MPFRVSSDPPREIPWAALVSHQKAWYGAQSLSLASGRGLEPGKSQGGASDEHERQPNWSSSIEDPVFVVVIRSKYQYFVPSRYLPAAQKQEWKKRSTSAAEE